MPQTPRTDSKPVRLVIADVDGTLVTHDKILTERAIRSVFKLREAGIQFVITSGRPPKGMAMLIGPLKLDEPIAAFNGGVVIQPDLKTVLRQNVLPPDVVKKVIPQILDHKLDARIYTDTTWFVRDINAPHVAREQWTVKFEPVVTDKLESLVDKVAKVVSVSDDLEGVARCEKDAGQLRFKRLGRAIATLLSRCDASQRQQRRSRADHVRTAEHPPQEIATIGDMPNDVLMFVKSGVSIAMGNASPEVQKSATYVTTSSEEEGFANAMEKFILQRHSATP